MATWHELIVHGTANVTRAFVAGFVAGRGGDPTTIVLYDTDVGVEHHSFGERLRELLETGATSVVFVPDALFRPLAEAFAQRGPALGLRVERSRAVRRASFRLEATVFARDLAARLRALLAPRDEGVRIERMSEREEDDPSARGVELYAPAHEYVYQVSADVAGELDAVVTLRNRASALDCVDVGPLQLEETLHSTDATRRE
jgi:hypothetical protein